jgi:4-hydroxy-tetrahydrodipicolinate synthase
MSESADVLQGVIVPLLTPVDENERVDEPALRALIGHCVRGGVDGIFVGGTAGLGPLLTDDQWKRLMEIARDEVPTSFPLLAGVIAPSTSRAIERIRILDRLGFENMVVTPTFYVTPTREEEFLSHFDGCRQATDMNMVVYNIPSCTNASIPSGILAKMVAAGWTRTVKESSGDRDYFLAVMNALEDTSAAVLQGNEPDIAWGLSSGARGLVPVCANYAPRLFTAVWRASQAGEEGRLDELQARISSVRDVLLMGAKHWLAGALYGVHTLGIGSGHVARPIPKLTEVQQREIDLLTEALAIAGPR